MNTDRILPVNREHLLLMQVLCWLGPGIKVLTTGMQAIDDEQQDDKCFLEYQPEGQFVRGH